MAGPALLLVSDWDETITSHDTLCLIAPKTDELEQGTRPFQYYENEYFKDQSDFKSRYGAVDSEAKLLRYVADVAEAEQATLDKVVDGGLFKGTTIEDRRTRAHQVQFREGWRTVKQNVRELWKDSVRFHIVSVNWSRRFILDALLLQDGKQPCACLETDLQSICFAEIHANEIEEHCVSGHCTGRIVGPLADAKPMLTGMDKRTIFNSIKEQYTPNSPLTIYVGDGLHDLPCILDADVGILMGTNPRFLEKLEKADLKQRLMTPAAWKEALAKSQPCCPAGIVHVESWHEVLEVIQAMATTLEQLACLRSED